MGMGGSNEFDLKGLRPTVGLRRLIKTFLASAKADARRESA